MSTFTQKFFLTARSPIFNIKRYRGKINIQKPKQPHYERARVVAVTTPRYPKPNVSRNCFEPKTWSAQQPNPYNDIIAREVLNWLNHSKMVAIFHINSINSDDTFKMRVELHKQNMHYKSYGKKIIEKAVENTKFEPISSLFVAHHGIVFSSEEKVNQLLKITKKYPQMILLAGIVQNTFLSKNEFTEFGKMPDLQAMRSQFVGVLNMAASQLVNNLETHQKSFVNVLDVYAKSGDTNETPAPSSQEDSVKTESEGK